MTTIVAVRKNGRIAIGCDSLTSFGDTRVAKPYKREHDKILHIAGSYMGVCGSSAHHLVLEAVFARHKNPKLGSRAEVYETFRKLHSELKEHAFLNPKEGDDDPYESSQITALIANPSGIYGVYSYREVFDYDRFWAEGSGRNYALGAMYAVYDTIDSAAGIARIGIEAGIEFDKSSGAPYSLHEMAARPAGRARRAARTEKR
ncbi:MAG: MFS transporter [Betaproteobacteria bacterium]|nr:MFS transporter [Betaproteobacteria bacterium]